MRSELWMKERTSRRKILDLSQVLKGLLFPRWQLDISSLGSREPQKVSHRRVHERGCISAQMDTCPLADGLADFFLRPCFSPFTEPHNHLTHKKKAIKNVFYRLSLAYKTLLQRETLSQPSHPRSACQASLFSQEEFEVTPGYQKEGCLLICEVRRETGGPPPAPLLR